MKYTPNYNLKKPEPTDNYNVENDNDNMEIIDAQLKLNSQKVEEIKDELQHLDLDAANVKLESPHFTATNVLGGLEELFQRGVDVKEGLVAKLNAMNVSASTSETIDELLLKILDISKDANATVADVLTGRTFYQGGLRRNGTMPLRSGHVNAQSISRSGTNLRLRPPQGYVPGDAGNSIQWNDPNWVSSNIRQGVSIFGVSGTFNGKRWAKGKSSSESYTLEIRGLDFRPSIVIAFADGNYGLLYASYYVDPSAYPSGTTRRSPLSVSIGGQSFGEINMGEGWCEIYSDGFSIYTRSFSGPVWLAYE